MLANRSFGGAQVSRTFYARGQTGQQLLLGAYQALERQIGLGKVAMFSAPRDARAGRGRRQGARHRHPRHGHGQDRVAPGRRGGAGDRRLRQRLLPRDQRQGLQRHRDLARLQEGRRLRQPLLHADPPHLHPGHRRLPEQAHADERVAAQRRPHLGAEEEGRQAAARRRSPRSERDYYLERKYPTYGNLAPRDIASRAAKQACDEGRGVGPAGLGVYLDFADAIKRLGEDVIGEKYGNLFEMYERITDEDPYKVPMRIYPAVHYTMGGLWVDYNLMSTIPGLHVHRRGELLGPRRQPARRLARSCRAWPTATSSSLHDRQLPGERRKHEKVDADHPEVKAAEAAVQAQAQAAARPSRASAPSTSFHRELGQAHVGRLRHGAQRGRAWRRRCRRSPRCARSSGRT